MQKIKKILGSTILVCIVMLFGCSNEQIKKWDQITRNSSDTTEGKYIEECRTNARILAKQEKSIQDMYEQVRYFEICEDGNGIAVFLNSIESDDNASDDCIVFRTNDGGDTWQMNPELLSLAHGGGELRLIENHVIIVEYNDKLEASECFVSHDYGRSFNAFSAGEIVFESQVYPHGTFRGEILSVDEAKKMITLAWNTESPYLDRREECNLMTAVYDFDFNMKELINVDRNVLAHEYVSQYLNKEILPDSDNKYLMNEEIQTLLNWVPKIVPNEKVLRYAINEIYARKGYDFTGTIYETYFEEKEWYENLQKKEVNEDELKPCEKANIDLLYTYEKAFE